mgnify:FL=1
MEKKDKIMRASQTQKPLARNNFMFMVISGAMIVLGFVLMLGGATSSESFNEEIFSTRRIVIGPAIAFLGFVAMAVAIIIRPKFKNKD